MAEIPAAKVLRCGGCSRQFDADQDLCPIPHVIGTADVGQLCARCHVTVLGEKPNHTFRQLELLPVDQAAAQVVRNRAAAAAAR